MFTLSESGNFLSVICQYFNDNFFLEIRGHGCWYLLLQGVLHVLAWVVETGQRPQMYSVKSVLPPDGQAETMSQYISPFIVCSCYMSIGGFYDVFTLTRTGTVTGIANKWAVWDLGHFHAMAETGMRAETYCSPLFSFQLFLPVLPH